MKSAGFVAEDQREEFPSLIVIDLEVFGSNHAGQHLENCPASVSDLKSQVDAASRYIVDPITGPKEVS